MGVRGVSVFVGGKGVSVCVVGGREESKCVGGKCVCE